LPLVAEHLIEGPARLFLKIPTPLLTFFAIDSSHGRSSLIGWAVRKHGNPLPTPFYPAGVLQQRSCTLPSMNVVFATFAAVQYASHF
jgi:hypothetical protein